MKRIKILSRRKKLEKKQKKLEKKQLNLKKEVEDLKAKCKHEIVLKTQTKGNGKTKIKEESFCLFCNGMYPPNNGIIIKIEEYACLNAEAAKDTLEKMYKSLREEFPEDTEVEIAKKIVEKLEEYKRKEE